MSAPPVDPLAATSLTRAPVFRAVFDNALDAMLILHQEGAYVEANPAACRLLGRSREELLSMRVGGVSPAGMDPSWIWREVREKGKVAGTWRVQRPDGTTRDVEFAASSFLPGLNLAVMRDVTESRAVEAELRKERELLQTVLDSIPLMISISKGDEPSGFEWVNREFERVLGWTREEAARADFVAAIIPDSADRAEAVAYIRQPTTGWRDQRIASKDGRVLDTSWAQVPLSGDRRVYIGQDVTHRKRAEAERDRRTAQLQRLSDAALAIGAATSLDEISRVATEAAREIIGAHQAVTSFSAENWAQAIRTVSLSDKYDAYRGYQPEPDGSGIYRVVCRTNRPQRLTQAEIEAHPEWRGFGAEAGRHPPMRGWLAVPLIGRDGRNLGLIQLSDKHEGEFGEDDEAMLVQLAQLASEAIENARLLEEVRHAHEQTQALSRRLVHLQEEERRTIARELHDEVAQILASLKFLVEASERTVTAGAREQVNEMTRQLLDRLRDMSLDLRPPMLDDLGLVPTLLWHFERYRTQTGIRVRFHHQGVVDRLGVGEITAFRIIQEALTNVARHAGVTEVSVDLWTDGERVGIRVADQGRGFEPAKLLGASSGLAGMRERALLLGGSLAVESSPGLGTRVVADLPLHAGPPG